MIKKTLSIYKLLLIFLLISNITFGQEFVQHEPEIFFKEFISKESTTQYVKDNYLKSIVFYRDTILSSSMEFDINGNLISSIGMENDYVRKSIRKWDDHNRILEIKYFSPDNSLSYGYYYRYENNEKLVYKMEDSLLFTKTTFIEPENINIYSEYDSIGRIFFKSIYVKDVDLNWLLETRFQDDRIYVQYRYEYLNNKKYITKVQFDDNGTKINEKRYLDEINYGNKIEYYAEEDERLFKIESFDKRKNLIKMQLFNENKKITNSSTYEYNSSGQIVKLAKLDLSSGKEIIYTVKYDQKDRIEFVTKDYNGKIENFIYKYQTF